MMLRNLGSIAVLSLLALPFVSQTTHAETPEQSSANLPSAPHVMTAEQVPFVSITAGFDYLQTNLTNANSPRSTYQMGWYGRPQLYLTKHISAVADFDSFSNWHAGQADNIHTFLGGPQWELGPHWHLNPFVFAEGGAVRDSHDGHINWDPAADGGIGMNFKVSKMFSVQVIPGEYLATKSANGDWNSNYVAKVGFTFNTFRIRHKKV